MSGFEIIFSLFGLLLGFTLVEVLGGLARTVEAQLRPARKGVAPIRYGWLTPLLGLFVLLDATTFWGSAWGMRNELTMSYAILMLALFFTATYYVAAHLVFPTDPHPGEDLDDHYFRVRRLVFGALFLLSLVQVAGVVASSRLAARIELWMLAESAVFHLLLIAGMLVRGRRANIAVLGALIFFHLYSIPIY